MTIECRAYDDEKSALDDFISDAAAILKQALSERGRAHLILSGGRTPKRYLPHLAKAIDSWQDVDVSLCDERWVDSNAEDSNEGMIRKTFLAGAPDAKLHGLMGLPGGCPDDDAHGANLRYDTLPWPADVSLLGAAPDGHIASLFPGNVPENSPNRVIVTHAPDGQTRLSLAPWALLETRYVLILASGAEKIAKLKDAMTLGGVNELPARLVLCQDRVSVGVYTFP